MLKNQKGQILIESVLILVLSLVLLTSATKYLKDQNIVQSLIAGPWNKTSAMIESGSWASSAEQGRLNHPNRGKRSRSQRDL